MTRTVSPWRFCAAGTALLFCTVGLSTSCFSVYQPYLISVVGLSNAEASLFLTVRTLSGLICTLLVSAYIGRFGLRRGVGLAGLLTSAGFISLMFAHGFASSCVCAVLLGVGYGLSGTVVVSMMIHRVFTRHMGLALSICAAGTGVSTIVCPPVATWLIESYSLRTALIAEAAFIFAVVLAVYIVLRALPPEEETAREKKTDAVRGKMSLGCKLCLCAMLCLGMIGNAGWSHLSVLYRTAGFTPAQTALLISCVGAFLTAGKLIFGECADMIGAKLTFRIACVVMTVGVLLACLAERGSMVIAVASMLCLGLSLPMTTVGPGLVGQSFSSDGGFDRLVRLQQVAYMVGTLVFTPVPGILADRSGSYVPAFKVLAVIAVLTTALFFTAYKGKER